MPGRGVDWFQLRTWPRSSQYPRDHESTELLEFLRTGPGFVRGNLESLALRLDGEGLREMAEGFTRVWVATRGSVQGFELDGLDDLFDFHQAACPHEWDDADDDGVQWGTGHDCGEVEMLRPLVAVGEDLHMGFNEPMRVRLLAAVAAAPPPSSLTVGLLWGPLYSNTGAKRPDADVAPAVAHRRQGKRAGRTTATRPKAKPPKQRPTRKR